MMAVSNLFKTTTSVEAPLDASGGSSTKPGVSGFLTVQSLTNFAAMTGSITAAWRALQRVYPPAESLWVPYLFATAFGIISILMSLDGLRKGDKIEIGTLLAAIFVACINSLVLASAVVGADVATGQPQT
jgi:hypothetical protein